MSSNNRPTKALIINYDKDPEGRSPIRCHFNPKEYSVARQVQWQKSQQSGSNQAPLEFAGGNPATLTVELFFDTFGTSDCVREKYILPLWTLTIVDADLKDSKNKIGRPPKVKFVWGRNWSFVAAITSLTVKFTLFDVDGTPKRATANVTMTQLEDDSSKPRQNPTSGGEGGERLWTVSEGDTLGWIAYKELGHTRYWRNIAEFNNLSQVRDLPPGMVLVIPNV